jgi:hypothetical protein
MKFDDRVFFFENLARKNKYDYNPTKINGGLHKDLCTFMTASHNFLMRNISTVVVEKTKKSENRAVYETM